MRSLLKTIVIFSSLGLSQAKLAPAEAIFIYPCLVGATFGCDEGYLLWFISQAELAPTGRGANGYDCDMQALSMNMATHLQPELILVSPGYSGCIQICCLYLPFSLWLGRNILSAKSDHVIPLSCWLLERCAIQSIS